MLVEFFLFSLLANRNKKKKKKKPKKNFQWNARNSDECLDDLLSLIQELKKQLKLKYNTAVGKEVKELAKIFDLEETIALLGNFHLEENSLVANREDIVKWETHGPKEFKRFFINMFVSFHTCNLCTSLIMS